MQCKYSRWYAVIIGLFILNIIGVALYSWNESTISFTIIRSDNNSLITANSVSIKGSTPFITSTPHPSTVKSEYFLTLMTSFSHIPVRNAIETNTVKNWANLGSEVKCLNWYTNDTHTPVTQLGDKLGWMKKEFTHKIHDLPIVKYLFVNGALLVPSDYYGFANSDILFGAELLETLHVIDKHHKANHPNKQFLLIGRRTNVDFSIIGNQTLNSTRILELKKKGKLFRTDAIDYFVTPANGYPWSDILGVVVARMGWDNYVVSYANDHKIVSYDVTNTVTAIHESYKGKGSSGSDNNDGKINYPILTSKRKDMIKHILGNGHTLSTSHITERDKDNNIVIKLRPKKGKSKPKGK